MVMLISRRRVLVMMYCHIWALRLFFFHMAMMSRLGPKTYVPGELEVSKPRAFLKKARGFETSFDWRPLAPATISKVRRVNFPIKNFYGILRCPSETRSAP